MYRSSVRLDCVRPFLLIGDEHPARFFETEGIAVMATLLSQYKIEVKEDPCFANETFEQRKARLLRSKAGLTLT